MIPLSIMATVVAAVFAVATWRAASGRSNALKVWSLALLQFAIASGALTWGVAFGWTPAAYRTFYLFGAVLNVVWLGLGTLWLSGNETTSRMATEALIGLTFFASFIVITALFVPGAITELTEQFPATSRVMPIEVRIISRMFSTIGSVVVLVGLVQGIRRRRNVAGLSLLALGVVVVALASELARQGHPERFCIGLALGVVVMYVGFLRTRSA